MRSAALGGCDAEFHSGCLPLGVGAIVGGFFPGRAAAEAGGRRSSPPVPSASLRLGERDGRATCWRPGWGPEGGWVGGLRRGGY